MVFNGISRVFDLTDEQQYDTIGQFWDELAARYGLEKLQGLGYAWQEGKISYAIGFRYGIIPGADLHIQLPDEGWQCIRGRTEELKQLYDGLYRDGPLHYEIETFYEDGSCEICYYRADSAAKDR